MKNQHCLEKLLHVTYVYMTIFSLLFHPKQHIYGKNLNAEMGMREQLASVRLGIEDACQTTVPLS